MRYHLPCSSLGLARYQARGASALIRAPSRRSAAGSTSSDSTGGFLNWLVRVSLDCCVRCSGTMCPLGGWPSQQEDSDLMSMQPQPWPEPADDVAEAVRAMFAGRRAPLAVVVRDELNEVFADAEFAEA